MKKRGNFKRRIVLDWLESFLWCLSSNQKLFDLNWLLTVIFYPHQNLKIISTPQQNTMQQYIIITSHIAHVFLQHHSGNMVQRPVTSIFDIFCFELFDTLFFNYNNNFFCLTHFLFLSDEFQHNKKVSLRTITHRSRMNPSCSEIIYNPILINIITKITLKD